MKNSIHASIVDDSFEDLERLAAVAGEEEYEEIDGEGDEDSEDEESDDLDSDEAEGDEDSEDEYEEVAEYEEAEEAEGDEDSDTFEEVVEDADGDSEDDEEVEFVSEDDSDEEAEGDEDSDDEYEEVVDESEGCDASDEEAVLASLVEQGLCVIVGTADQISELELGVAIASLEDEEFGSEEADSDEEEFEDESSDTDEDESEDEIEDETEESAEDEDSEEDGEDADSDNEDESEESEESEDEGDEYEESDDEDESEAGIEDLDEDRLAPVASESMLAHADVGDVDLVFHANKSNPVWNVIVAGVPAARIALSSYGDGAHEVASFFVTAKFADGLKRAMASEGVLGLLKQSNAEFYCNAYKSGDVFAEARSAAESVSTQKVTAAISGLREDYLDALRIASAGMDKNIFKKTNHLKRELFISLANAGVQDPAKVIEAAFAGASAKHFEVLSDLATELLDKAPEYREQLRETIEESGTLDRSGEAPVEQQIQAATASTSNSALSLIKGMAATASTEARAGVLTGTTGARKDVLRNLLQNH